MPVALKTICDLMCYAPLLAFLRCAWSLAPYHLRYRADPRLNKLPPDSPKSKLCIEGALAPIDALYVLLAPSLWKLVCLNAAIAGAMALVSRGYIFARANQKPRFSGLLISIFNLT